MRHISFFLILSGVLATLSSCNGNGSRPAATEKAASAETARLDSMANGLARASEDLQQKILDLTAFLAAHPQVFPPQPKPEPAANENTNAESFEHDDEEESEPEEEIDDETAPIESVNSKEAAASRLDAQKRLTQQTLEMVSRQIEQSKTRLLTAKTNLEKMQKRKKRKPGEIVAQDSLLRQAEEMLRQTEEMFQQIKSKS
jgi:hypothetical protein